MATITTALTESHLGQQLQAKAAQLPRNYYLWGGLGMLAGSIALHYLKWHKSSRVLGQLASPVLMMAFAKNHPGKKK